MAAALSKGRGGRKYADFRDSQIQLGVLAAVCGVSQDEAGEMNRGQL